MNNASKNDILRLIMVTENRKNTASETLFVENPVDNVENLEIFGRKGNG